MDEEDTNKYERPSELLESVIDVESSPAVLVSPTGEWAVILRYRMLNLDLKDLSQDFVRTAGLSFDPKLMIPEKTVFARSIHLKKIFDSTTGPVVEEEQEVQGLDAYDGFRYFSWHPEGKGIVFTARKRSPGGNDRLDLMMVSIESATSGNGQTFTAKPLVSDRTLTAVVGSPSKFIGDGSHIICFVRPEGLGPAPKEPEVAQGPTIKENLSTKKVPARTYQRLITSKHKRDLFEHYARSDVMVLRIDANDGSITRHTLIQNEMVRSVSLSPDGRLLLVSVTRKPFSWTLPYSKFAKDIQVFQVSQALSKYPPPLSHSKALGKHPAYPERSAVDTVSFDSPCESYSPVDFTHPVVFANDCTEKQGGWADPPVEKLTAQELEERFSYHGRIFLKNGVPQNPVGRTGMTGRGLLGKWGPNHAADAIVTRFHQGKLQMVAIQRKDTGNWAIPGGMVDPGESVPAAMKREFMEEAGNLDLTPAEAEEHKRKVDRLFSNGYEIYRGYVDDPRNTDNAWMESSFVHFHCDDELGESLKLEAGDDAGAVTWLDIDESKDAFKNLYASHKEMVLRAAQRLSKTSAGVGVRDGDIHITDRKVIISLPDQEGVPISFDARMRGPRGFGWHWQKPHTLLFRYALDKGDPKAPSVNGMRDALYMLQAPFRLSQDLDVEPASASEDVSPVFQAEYRISSVRWAKASRRLGIVSESWHKTRRVRTWLVKEGPSDGEFVAGKLFERSSDDAYASPGSPLVVITRDGLLELQQGSKDGAFEFLGSGASPIGSRPFYDKVSVDETFAGGDQVKFKTERLWRCTFAPDADTALIDLSKEVGGKLVDVSKRAAVWEDPEEVIGDGEWVLLTRESNDEPANYFWHHVPSGKEWQLTSFAHPQPSLVGVQTSLVSYERLDGVELNGELYMPSGYEPARDGPRPCLLWSYPREFKAKETAGQVKTSPHKFTSTSWARPLLWVLKGWNVLSFSSPIVGEGDSEPNDTFVEQVQLNARAAVEFLIDRKLGKVGGFAVGGHSYGAFMTSHLLAHTDFFSAGIARSGAYLRALTPFGFQAEERSFWEAPETYMELSPFSHAPKIAANGGKLLLIHGMDDENSGTFPMQSERLYDALKGHGGVTKLVLLPKEGHGYVARESILHTVAEQERWLDRYVVADFDKLPVRSLPPTSPVSRVPRKLASSAGVVNPMMANRAHHLVALTVALIAGVAVYRAARL